MKRRKKQTYHPRQLCLFDVPALRQEEEARTKKRKKRVEAVKPSALTLVPPEAIEAVKTPKNGLKTEILSKDELNRF